MNYKLQDSDLSTVLAEGRLVADETRRAFGRLSAAQVNWTPRAGEWSIGQCFDHLIISDRPYFQIIEEIREGRRRQRAWERMPLLPRFFGKLIINTLRPDSDGRSRRGQLSIPRAATSLLASSRASSSSWIGFCILWSRPVDSTSMASRSPRP